MAIQIEKNGNAFYQKAAKAAADNALKKLFKDLANMEDLHEKYFLKLKKELTAKERVQDVYDPDAEGVLYLNAFASGHIFKVDSNRQGATGEETIAVSR
jgi:rubrerythrin